ncbi:MAG: glycosyltransferase family 2 protein [Cardiobacteriaceae bacterium]|nr:glycosyltransferase family 2 protein [Cardiobacteriaceae bacterium]
MLTTALIITTFRRPDALEKVLQSVLNQSVLPTEIIVAEDDLSDETVKIIEKFRAQTSTPILHIRQEHNGFRLALIRNKAILAASAQYLIFIDGDCVLERNFVADHQKYAKQNCFLQGSRALLNKEKTEKFLKSEEIKISFFDAGFDGNRKNALRLPFISNFLIRRLDQKLKGIRACNFSLFRTDCLLANGFDSSFIGWGREDSEFIARLYNNGIYRRKIKFSALMYHLWHEPNSRQNLKENEEKLSKTIASQLKTTANGIKQLAENSS